MIPVQWIVYGVVALAVVAGATFAVHSYNSAIERAAQAEQAASTWMGAAQQLSENISKQNQELARRETARRKIEEQRDAAYAELEELRRRDPAAASWMDQPIPDSVLGRLRQRPGANAAVPDSPPKPDSRNPTPAVPRDQ